MSNLRKRTATGVLLVVLFVGCMAAAAVSPIANELVSYFGFLWCMLAAYELSRFSSNRFEQREQALIHLSAFLLPSVIVILTQPLGSKVESVGGVVIAGGILSFLLVLSHALFPARKTLSDTGTILASGLLGVLHTGIGSACLVALTRVENFVYFLPWVVFSVVVNDTAAYFFGKQFGKRKLNPILSPGKTVAGSLGGYLSGVLVSLLGWFLLPLDIPVGEALIGILFLHLAAQLGDLCVSFLKRLHHVKDSGEILPGHGGMLDRLDGLLFACSVFILLLSIYDPSLS